MADKPGSRCGNGAPRAERWNVSHNGSARPRSLETRKGRGFPHSHSDGDCGCQIGQTAKTRVNHAFFQILVQNHKKRMGTVFLALLMCGLVSQASAQDAEPKFNSNGDDLTKIRGVLEEFRQDIIRKDGYALTKLVLNPDVLFHHTNTQEEIDSARKYNAQFDGIGPSQLDGFAKLLATSKDKLEERFRNIEIRQDGPLGLVTFNYDFVINDKVHHSGLEVWQVCKIDGQWKILSVAWTIY